MTIPSQFGIWLTRLGGRVRYLESNIPRLERFELEREANTCEAELRRLYDFAGQHAIDIVPYYPALADIEGRLLAARREIQRRTDRSQATERPFWQRVVNVVVKAINFIAGLFGLYARLPRIGGREDYPRLPSG